MRKDESAQEKKITNDDNVVHKIEASDFADADSHPIAMVHRRFVFVILFLRLHLMIFMCILCPRFFSCVVHFSSAVIFSLASNDIYLELHDIHSITMFLAVVLFAMQHSKVKQYYKELHDSHRISCVDRCIFST